MARTRKSIQPLNLLKYDVLINDVGPRSDYFLISQFDGYFYGGRNSFLIAGTNVLKPNSEILIEILDVDGNTVYSAPVPQFIEGNSRLVKIEVYSDTPIGPGKIVILGSANSYIDGRPIPQDWIGKYNIRWVSDVIISPLIENKTPLRFVSDPKIQVSEKFYNAPSSSVYDENIVVPVDANIFPKYYNIFLNGYLIELSGSSANNTFYSFYKNGILTGSIHLTSPLGIETASINLPITKIFNNSLAESTGSLIKTTKNNIISEGFISSSGSYTGNISPIGDANITSSLNIQYNRLQTENTGSVISFAKIRLVDLNTVSGEIHKVRVSYKPSTEPGEFVILGDVNTKVQELFAVDSGSKIVATGNFSDTVISDYWYASTMSLQKNEIEPTLPVYYTSSSIYTNLNLQQKSNVLLDAITANIDIVSGSYIDNSSYFIGSKNSNSILLFPRSEYTLSFQAFVTKTSASVELSQTDYSLEVYLVPQENSEGKLLDLNPRGQLLGTLTPSSTFFKQNFETVNFNFIPKINFSGNFGIRFVAYGGFWNIANVSVKVAEEPFYSPDEVDILIPNVNYYNKFLTFKTEYLDVNNNSVGISTISSPVYFTGSANQTGLLTASGSTTVTISTTPPPSASIGNLWWNSEEGQLKIYYFDGDSYQWVDASGETIETGSYGGGSGQGFPYTGSAIISGSLIITGSLQFTEGGTYITGSASLAEIDGAVFALNSQYLVLSQSDNLTNERVLSLSDRFSTSDAGANSNYSVDLSTNMRTSTVGVVIDGGGSAITTGEKVELLIPFSASIQSWTLLADRSGSITVDIWKSTYAAYPPTGSNSITAAARPFISASVKNTSSSLAGWTTNIDKNDTLKFYVSASSTVQRVNLTLELLRV